MRKPIIVGNWKMNKTPSEALEFMKGIEEVLTGEEAADYGIGAPYVDLDVCVKNAKARNATCAVSAMANSVKQATTKQIIPILSLTE